MNFMYKHTKKIQLILLCTCTFLFLHCSKANEDEENNNRTIAKKSDSIPPKNALVSVKKQAPKENPCFAFQALNTQIRDGQMRAADAQKEIQRLLPEIDAYYAANGGVNESEKDWKFPLKGYSTSAIGGTGGNGYISKGYNYFDGNKHGGHPAQDIFIRDKNQDCLDDKTQDFVSVQSISGGIVVANETQWDTASSLRGGMYIWIYQPAKKALFYYAHNASLSVSLGDIVVPGQEIAKVGRTGLNAFKKRSPTHLHVSMLEVSEEGKPTSKNLYPILTSHP
jgi:peptidoglycan LD-endopeptidase LytH